MEGRHNPRTRIGFAQSFRIPLVQKAVQVRIINEDLGTHEIQQREQLLQAILQRRARDQQSSAGDEGADDL